jgi:hypothetical protein
LRLISDALFSRRLPEPHYLLRFAHFAFDIAHFASIFHFDVQAWLMSDNVGFITSAILPLERCKH